MTFLGIILKLQSLMFNKPSDNRSVLKTRKQALLARIIIVLLTTIPSLASAAIPPVSGGVQVWGYSPPIVPAPGDCNILGGFGRGCYIADVGNSTSAGTTGIVNLVPLAIDGPALTVPLGIHSGGGIGGITFNVSAANSPSPTLIASVSTSGIPPGYIPFAGGTAYQPGSINVRSTAIGNLSYNATVIAPVNAVASVLVPILFSGNYNALASLNAGSSTSVSLGVNINTFDAALNANTSLFNWSNLCTGSLGVTSGCGAGQFSGSFSLLAGATYTTSMTAKSIITTFASSGATAINASAYGLVDPYYYIDPVWLTSNPGYSLAFDANISNVVAVPEPETYAMMMAGLGVMGVVGRRRKNKAA
jgi:hypothetical protein